MWYAISYKRLEIMCIHLDGGLDGAAEVNEAARKDNSLNHEGIFGVGYHSLGGPAAVMLKSTQDSVISVANRVGYSNPGKFAAAFKNVLGVMPTEYRKSFFSGIKLTFIV